MVAKAAFAFSNILRLSAAIVMVALFMSALWQNRARAQQGEENSDASARGLVGSVIAAHEKFYVANQRYAELSELFASPAYVFPMSPEEAGNYRLSVVLSPAQDSYVVFANGSGTRYSSNDELGIDGSDFRTVNERARILLRETISAQAAHYAAHGSYGSLAQLIGGGFLRDTDSLGHSGLGVLVKVMPADDGQSYRATTAGVNMQFSGDQTGEIRDLKAISAADAAT